MTSQTRLSRNSRKIAEKIIKSSLSSDLRYTSESITSALSDAEKRQREKKNRDTEYSYKDPKGSSKARLKVDDADQINLQSSVARSRRGIQSQRRLFFNIDGLSKMPENIVFAKTKTYIMSMSGHKVVQS